MRNEQSSSLLLAIFETDRLAPSVGSASCVHRFGDQMVSITTSAAPTVSQGETIRFGSLEFLVMPRDGLWAPPPFQPLQSFRFRSLEFITDQLGALHLCEPGRCAPAVLDEPAPLPKLPRLTRRRSSHRRIKKCRPSRPTCAVLRHIALMIASNPAAEDVDLILYSLANVSRQLTSGTLLPPPYSTPEQLGFSLANSVDTYV